MEALGAGNAVIAHDNPFNRWVAGAAGRYFDGQAAAQAPFYTLLDDVATLAAMRDAARCRHVEAFTWPAVLGNYERLLAYHLPRAG